MRISLVLAFFCACLAGCGSSPVDSPAPTTNTVSTTTSATAVPNRTYEITFKVVRAPNGSEIHYKYGSQSMKAIGGNDWSMPIKAAGGTNLYLGCTRPFDYEPVVQPITVQIVLGDKVLAEKTSTERTVSCGGDVPYPPGFVTPTPHPDAETRQAEAREYLDERELKMQTIEDERKERRVREDARYRESRAARLQSEIAEMRSRRNGMIDNLRTTSRPGYIELEIKELDREIEKSERDLANVYKP